jgi:predicted ATPase
LTARFAFRHALYQDVLYSQVSPTRRVELHRAIGVQLERAHGDRAGEIAAELAAHFDLGGDAARAVRYLQHAGRSALANSAHHEAIRHFTRALELLPLAENRASTEREVALLLGLGPAWMAARGYAASEVGDTYARALVRCRRLGETPQLFRVLKGLWNFHLVRAELDTARDLSEELLARAKKRGDLVLMVRAHAELGQTLFHQGEIARAQEHFRQAEAYWTPPRLDEAEAAFATALSLARDLGSRALEIRAGVGWGRLLLRRGRPADVAALLTPVVDGFPIQAKDPDLDAARDLLRSTGA